MTIDPQTEQLVLLKDAGKHVPRPKTRRAPNRQTIWRWADSGLRGVQLETIMLGGCRYTSVEALQRFFAAQNTPKEPEEPRLTKGQRERQAIAANKALEEEGF